MRKDIWTKSGTQSTTECEKRDMTGNKVSGSEGPRGRWCQATLTHSSFYSTLNTQYKPQGFSPFVPLLTYRYRSILSWPLYKYKLIYTTWVARAVYSYYKWILRILKSYMNLGNWRVLIRDWKLLSAKKISVNLTKFWCDRF